MKELQTLSARCPEFMKKIGVVISLLLLLCSCTSTDAFTSPRLLSPEIALEEKLSYAHAEPVSVSFPEIYFDGTEWLERFTELVEEAEDYILISTFLGSDAPALEKLYRAIMDASERGVRVYFIMDGISALDMTESKHYMTPLYFLRSAGVHLVEYNPVSVTHLMNPGTIIMRNHIKLVVVDGSYSAIGGMNMNYISLGSGKNQTQRDSMFLFNSPSLASAMIDTFISLWNDSCIEKLERDSFPVSSSSDEGEYSAWLVQSEGTAEMFASLIGSATEHLVIFPYLPALDGKMKSALGSASGRGVDVDIIMPVDLRGYAASGIYSALPDLIKETGADVFVSVYDEDGNILPLLHEKLIIADSRYVIIGSANFNFRSMSLSKELSLLIDSPQLASVLEEHVQSVLAGSEEITYEDALLLKREEGDALSYLFMYFGG